VLVNGNAVLYVTAGALINFDPLADSISIAPYASLQLYVACDTANLPNVVNDQTPINFAYYGLPTNKNVTQKVNADFIGTVYAPSAKYTLGGNGIGAPQRVCGAVIADSVYYNDPFYFHYDNNLTRVAEQGAYAVTSWTEL